MSSSTLPPSLKKINVFLKRAEELDRDKSNPESRVVAYNCRQYAALIGIQLVSSSSSDNDNGAQAKSSLGQLLTTLEKEKQAMSVFSKNEHWKICRKVADRVFAKADNEDRSGVATKSTARSFYAAATFYEILQQFHDEAVKSKDGKDLDEDEASVMEHIEEEEQRRIYSKWKATDILTAIKEGRVPTPGGYQQENDESTDNIENNAEEGTGGTTLASIQEDKSDMPLPPPAPSTSSSLFEIPNQNDSQPPPYDGIELNLRGQPTSTTISATDDHASQDENNDDLFIPMPPPQQPVPPPPEYSQQNNPSKTSNNDAGNNSNGGKGMFSSIFHSNNSSLSSNKKLTKEQMGDAIELTKFALSALQKGDGELGRERLEQALGIWR